MKYQFECQTNCGKCCTAAEGEEGYVYLSDLDCSRLANKLGMSVEEFTAFHTEITYGDRHLKGVGTCRFLEGTKCSVHEARPKQCRTFPFWPSMLDEKSWTQLAEMCPGIGKGKIYSATEVSDLLTDAQQILPG